MNILIKEFSQIETILFIFIVLLTGFSSKSYCQPVIHKMDENLQAKNFFSSTIDSDNNLWFLTESGIVSYNGTKWILHNQNPAIPITGLKNLKFNSSSSGGELMIATPKGVIIAALPLASDSRVDIYMKDNSQMLSENVLSVAAGRGTLKWFGTDKGIMALSENKWLTNSYEANYPESMFEYYPITSMAVSLSGDTLYAATSGAGVIRVHRSNVDAVSGASEYAEWGPIIMPSDNVLCIYITPDGTQWLGTEKGVAKHTGYETLENWTVYNTANGLVDDFVQAINSDKKGNIWFGTKNGVSVFDGTKWKSFKIEDGLTSNNILSIAIDKNDVIWLGTDNGVTSISDGKLNSYQ